MHDQRGTALVEFAIAAPLLVLLLFGIIEFGRFFFLYNNLSNAAREGARIGAVTPAGTTAERTAAVTSIIAIVRARIADAGGTTADVQVTLPQTGQPNGTVRVRINDFPFLRVVPFIAPTQFPDIEAEFRYELQ